MYMATARAILATWQMRYKGGRAKYVCFQMMRSRRMYTSEGLRQCAFHMHFDVEEHRCAAETTLSTSCTNSKEAVAIA